MEIKQGDKVRVSGHYLAIMITDWIVRNALNNATFVVDNIDRKGRMAYVSCKLPISLQSPIAHLIKVDTEAFRLADVVSDAGLHQDNYLNEDKKEPKFKVNDVVRTVFNETTYITSVLENGNYYLYGMRNEYPEDSLTLIRSYTEPTEQTEAENQAFTLGERVVTPYGYGAVGKDIEGRIAVALEHGGFCGIDKAIKIIADNPVFDWDAYTADLAKELAISYAKRGKSPLDAVAAAKEITKKT